MKSLQVPSFEIGLTRSFWPRRKVRVLRTRNSVRNGALANTRILGAPTHGRVNRQPAARSLIGIDGSARMERIGVAGPGSAAGALELRGA
jgi:hypothetical protein